MPRVKTFSEEEVLKKAMELFWKKGFHATSISDLVKHLGINRASLYDTYGGKKELFDKAFRLYRKNNGVRLRQFLAAQPSVKEGIYRFLEMGVDEAISDKDQKGCFVVNVTTESIPEELRICDSLYENKVQFENLFTEYLKSGVKNGEIKADKDLKAIAASLFTFNNGLMVVSKVETDRDNLIASVKAFLTILD